MWYLLAVMGLRDKVVLVTGASGGIGEAIAGEFARGGAIVVVSSRNEEKLQALVDRLEREVAERWHCALETAKLGVAVDAICPGYVDTELTPRTLAEWPIRRARASRRS